MKSSESNNNRKEFYSIDKTNYIDDQAKTFYFPSLTHKELLSLNDLKHQIYYMSRTKKQQNHFNNFHTEVLKTNFKDNSKYSSLFNNISKSSKNESNFPELKTQKKIVNNKIIKLYMKPNPFSYLNSSIIKKNLKSNYQTMMSLDMKPNKINMSNISTTGNISLSINSYKLSKLNKLASNSVDLNNFSYPNKNNYVNSSNKNIKNDNSFEKKDKTYDSNDASSLRKKNMYKSYNEDTIFTKSKSSIGKNNENFNKKFLDNLNPIYALLKKEFLSEFNRKTKDITYLKYLLKKKKIDIELEKEKRISDVEKQDLNNYNCRIIYDIFNKFNDSKFEYLNYLKKTVSQEKEKNEKLKEDKIYLMYDIYTIRHKTLRLENRFRNYLNDKYFLLSVKNHSFTLNKFSEEDQEDYNNDLKKLEILNIMINVTSKEFQKENEIEKIAEAKKNKLDKTNNKISNYNNINSPRTLFKRKPKHQKTSSKSLLSRAQNNLIKTNFKASPVYQDIYDFNRDLQQTSNNIQVSLVKYNVKSKELQMMRNRLYETRVIIKNIKKYEDYIKEEIVIQKKTLENLKALNSNLENYKNYLLNLKVLNLNKGRINFKINKILLNIDKYNDTILNDYLNNLQRGTGIENLMIIERAIEFLLNYKEIQKSKGNESYIIISNKIDDKNRKKLYQFKQDNIHKKFNSIIDKIINKQNKIIFTARKKVNIKLNPEIHIKKNKRKKINVDDNNFFGNFDIE